jgi:hypothetical protein
MAVEYASRGLAAPTPVLLGEEGAGLTEHLELGWP